MLSIEMWSSAFIRFTAVYTHKFPLQAPQLMKYMEIVRDIAHRKPGFSFAFYDNKFRKARETSTLPWDSLHTEFWLMAVTFQSNHVSPQPFRSSRTGKAGNCNPVKKVP